MHLALSLSTLFVGFTLVGCGQSSGPSVNTPPIAVASAPSPAPKKEIGLVMKTLTNPFFVEMEKGARRAEKELGVTLTVKTAAQETSIEQQIQLVEDFIAAKTDAIVIAPGDSQRVVPALKHAFDAGIKIVNIDNRLDTEAIKQAGLPPIAFVSLDNEAGAYKVGKFLAEGVETIEHGSRLMQLGCDLAQGYGIARPMPATDIPKWLAEWRPDSAWTQNT